jgi:anaerobic magnesium-protoporphyrin IX monomethyl ester cyclase
MLNILVGHSYFLRYDRKQWERGKPYPPLATLQIAALLRRMDHAVGLFDAMLAEGVEDFAPIAQAQRPQLVVFYEDNFNFLTKMCLGNMRDAACRMIGEAKADGARVLVAGSDASDHPEAFLAAGADAVLTGEGIGALIELVNRLERDPIIDPEAWTEGVAGIATRSPAGTRVTRLGVVPPDPRISGLPAWDLVDMPRYRALWMERHGYFSLNMAASRGCPFRCNWCAKPIWGNHYNQRPPQDVAAEMTYLKQTYAPDHIWMADDIFGFHIDWVSAFAAEVQASDGSVPFMIQTRADLSSERMATALATAGCVEAWIGAESGSQRVLDRMTKGTKVPDLIAARQRLGAHGIRVGFFIQLGYLGEELDDLLATRTLVQAASPDDIGVSVSYPLPGTKFFEEVRAQLGRKTHWDDSGDLAMMFQGAYDTTFYREVRDLLHREVTDPGQVLDDDWAELLAREHLHRNAEPTPAAWARRATGA